MADSSPSVNSINALLVNVVVLRRAPAILSIAVSSGILSAFIEIVSSVHPVTPIFSNNTNIKWSHLSYYSIEGKPTQKSTDFGLYRVKNNVNKVLYLKWNIEGIQEGNKVYLAQYNKSPRECLISCLFKSISSLSKIGVGKRLIRLSMKFFFILLLSSVVLSA